MSVRSEVVGAATAPGATGVSVYGGLLWREWLAHRNLIINALDCFWIGQPQHPAANLSCLFDFQTGFTSKAWQIHVEQFGDWCFFPKPFNYLFRQIRYLGQWFFQCVFGQKWPNSILEIIGIYKRRNASRTPR